MLLKLIKTLLFYLFEAWVQQEILCVNSTTDNGADPSVLLLMVT